MVFKVYKKDIGLFVRNGNFTKNEYQSFSSVARIINRYSPVGY